MKRLEDERIRTNANFNKRLQQLRPERYKEYDTNLKPKIFSNSKIVTDSKSNLSAELDPAQVMKAFEHSALDFSQYGSGHTSRALISSKKSKYKSQGSRLRSAAILKVKDFLMSPYHKE